MRAMPMIAPITAAILSLSFTACGGGGGGSTTATQTPSDPAVETPRWLLSAAQAANARSYVGGAPLDVTPQQRVNSVNRLLQVTNSVVMHRMITDEGNYSASCQGVVCSIGGQQFRLAPEATSDWQAVMEFRGVDVGQSRLDVTRGDIRAAAVSYSGTMDHAGFQILIGGTESDRGRNAFLMPRAFGNASRINPPANLGSASWNGMMMATDVADDSSVGDDLVDYFIQGDATVTVDMDRIAPTVDVAFTNIRNLGTGVTQRDMRWNDVRLSAGRFANCCRDDDHIEGAFFGPSHQEVGGVFERNPFVGAFGAARE